MEEVVTANYDGDLVDDMPHGRGRCVYNNGDIYEGEWKEGWRHGFGVLIESSGCRYMGQFFEDKMHGFGTMYFPQENGTDMEIISGQWSGDKVDGLAVMHCTWDGLINAGQFRDSRPFGVSCAVLETGVCAGNMIAGEGYSYLLNYHHNGAVMFSIKKDGRLHGEQLTFAADGSRQVRCYYDGVSDGLARMEDTEGNMVIGGMDDEDSLHGDVTMIRSDGIKLTCRYNHGAQVSKWELCLN